MNTNPLDRMRVLANVINTSDRHMYETNPEWVKASEYAASRILSILASSDGWVCVPVEPNEAMIDAGRTSRGDSQFSMQVGTVYKAMLQASREPS